MSRVKDSYSIELSKIADMSLSDFCKLCPATSDKAAIQKLKAAVDDAAAKNLAQADLLNNIKKLGDTVYNLAKTLFPMLR